MVKRLAPEDRATAAPRKSRHALMHLAMLATVAFWSGNIIAGKEGLKAFGPMALAELRVTGAAALFGLIFVAWPGRPKIRLQGRDWLHFALMAFTGITLNQIFFIGGLARAPVADNGLIVALGPVMVLVMAAAIGLEAITALKVAGIFMALAGVFVLTFNFKARSLAPSWKGDLFQLIGTAAFALYTILVKRVADRYDPITLNTLCFAMGAVFLIPFAAHGILGIDWPGIAPEAMGGLLFMILLGSLAAYILFAYALTGLSASRVAAFNYLQPLIAIALGIWMLGEKLKPSEVVGGGLILLGLYLAESEQGSEDATPKTPDRAALSSQK